MKSVNKDIDVNLMKKYDAKAFMYVEYPHKSFWSNKCSDENHRAALQRFFSEQKNAPILLYVHTLHCPKQCYFCTCHTAITNEYEDVKNYLKIMYREFDLYHDFFKNNSITPNFQEVHLGGGSPTFLRQKEFDELIEKIQSIADIKNLAEFSIEIDPRRVKAEQMHYYHSKGINRISFGIQDFDLEVQKAVNRVQPASLTERLLTSEVRQLFKNGINFDIICGLPKQTKQSIRETMKKVVEMAPDRICLNYLDFAPKFAKHQLLMPVMDIPNTQQKKALFLEALEILLNAGYVRTGYDHFAKPNDDVAKAMQKKQMHWNSLGSTPGRCVDIIGIGVHSYGRLGQNYYSQNVYELPAYEAALQRDSFPIYRGHTLNNEDILRRDIIQQLRVYFNIDFLEIEQKYKLDFQKTFAKEIIALEEFVQDGLVKITDHSITITELGQQFANLVCRTFDTYVPKSEGLTFRPIDRDTGSSYKACSV